MKPQMSEHFLILDDDDLEELGIYQSPLTGLLVTNLVLN